MLKATTTRYSPETKKPFSWSYSKMKNFNVCPKRHYHVDLAKDCKEEEGDSKAMEWGKVVHWALAQRIGKGTPLPPVHHNDLEPWALKVLAGKGEIMVEQEWAITKDFEPCEWFAKDAWFRAKADVVKLNGPVGVVIDWKTGKIIEDIQQLALTAAVMFVYYPQLQVVRSKYVWTKENAETDLDIKRADVPAIWNNVWNDIEAMREAYEQSNYPPVPNRLCSRFCPVKQCPHHGQ